MDRMAEMQAFVQVIEAGGFTEAANRMGLSKSAVSKHVAALEARLAVRLLTRTTRRVSPTELGVAYYDRARRVLLDADEADSMVTAMQATPGACSASRRPSPSERGSCRGRSPNFCAATRRWMSR